MNNQQRSFVKNRTNRRVANLPYEGQNKRKGLGRRKYERYVYYSYFAVPAILIVGIIGIIVYNLGL